MRWSVQTIEPAHLFPSGPVLACVDTERKDLNIEGTQRLEIVEERLKVGKREEERVVRVHQRPVERTEHVRMELESQEVQLERVPMDRFVDEIPEVRHEGDVMVVPVVEEIVTVRLKLVEEVRVKRVAKKRIYEDDVVLRRNEVTLGSETDRTDPS